MMFILEYHKGKYVLDDCINISLYENFLENLFEKLFEKVFGEHFMRFILECHKGKYLLGSQQSNQI